MPLGDQRVNKIGALFGLLVFMNITWACNQQCLA